MSMTEETRVRVAEAQQDEQLEKLKDKVVRLVKSSRGRMSSYYKKWDDYNEAYRGLKRPDRDDVDAAKNDRPQKMIIPMSYAQIHTFASFCYALFTQNRRLFEMVPQENEAFDYRVDSEKLLERDLKYNKFDNLLYQWLIDVGRFNLGVLKHWWTEDRVPLVQAPETQTMEQQTAEGLNLLDVIVPQETERVVYQGNKIVSVSPYNFFPDVRFPLSRWEDGSYCADETEWHINYLKEEDRKGNLAGTEHVKAMDRDIYTKRGETRLIEFSKYMEAHARDHNDFIVVVTSCEIEIVPEEYGLGPEKHNVKYKVLVANDDRIISAEPCNNVHNRFSYSVGQYSPDYQSQIAAAISDMTAPLQDTMSFLVNSRLMSVKKGLEHQLVVDPSGVDITSLESRNPFVLLKKGAPKIGVDRFVQQLSYQDNTTRHLDDAATMMNLMQTTMGISENAMGQFASGRRSATEARAVNAGAAGRLKMVASILFRDGIADLGQKMLLNLRQGLDQEHFVALLGEESAERYPAFSPADPNELIGSYDNFILDSTLSSEKGFIAQSMQELIQALVSNPEMAMSLGLDIPEMVLEVMRLRGLENIERFKVQPTLNTDGTGALPGALPQAQLGAVEGGPEGGPSLQAVGGVPAVQG